MVGVGIADFIHDHVGLEGQREVLGLLIIGDTEGVFVAIQIVHIAVNITAAG